jgi:hypothetical protein
VAAGFLSVLLLRVGDSLMIGWMWRPAEGEVKIDEHLGQRGARTGPGTGQADRLGPTDPGPFRPGLATSRSPMLLDQLLTCSLMHVGP